MPLLFFVMASIKMTIMIKEFVKKIPYAKRIYTILRRFHSNSLSTETIEDVVFNYHRLRFKKYSGAFNDSEIKDISYLTWLYHFIEKGLAMPGMRLGFGHDKILELCEKIKSYEIKYGDCKQLIDAVSVVLEYKRVHEELNYKFENDILLALNEIELQFPNVLPLEQKLWTKEDYFNIDNLRFPEFALSRHSVRNFEGRVDENLLIKSIEMAKSAPSACNRQPTRVHIVANKDLVISCLKLQNGNRGFGHLSDKLLVITGDLQTCLGAQEFFDLNTNVGIFIMNLVYSLHYNKIAHCVLNWYAMPEEDQKLRKLLKIPDNENIVALIVCGNLPDKFKIVSSPRIEARQIYTIHK